MKPMITFLVRRLTTSALVVLISSFLMYFLVAIAVDPLSTLRASTMPTLAKQQQMAHLTAVLRLDEPIITRYFDWLKGASGCLYGQCNLGTNWKTHEAVTSMLSGAVVTTVQLVLLATVIAIVVGAAIGIISALRQYSGFDYSITFLSFLMYSLPVFWVAVMLKSFLAIDFNDFIQNGGQFSAGWIIGAALVTGLAVGAACGGGRARLLRIGGITAALVAALMLYSNVSDFFVRPSSGSPLDLIKVLLISVAIAFGVTTLSTGLRNRKALYTSLTVAAIGGGLYYPMLFFWNGVSGSWLLMIGLAVVSAAVGVGVGYAWGGTERSRSARTGAITAVLVAAVLFLDRLAQTWYDYTNSTWVHGRPIATSGDSTPNLAGSFWMHTTDLLTHIALPSITLVLVSMASYTRYVRASTLEVLNQDYIRTARAKGLTERTVIMRHAFRNALLPLASVVPVDILFILGGALITETVFGWSGMGHLFVQSLHEEILDPVMGYLLIVAILAPLANIVADVLYAVLDPRIRVDA
ncbi:ABC transporter permease [Nocardioides jejuensis]|nr:ABC transporter permease [Nocardioides jejuensis]